MKSRVSHDGNPIKRMLGEKVLDNQKHWWGKKDSNLRSHKTADLQSAPFATRDTPPLNNIASPPVEMAARRPLMTLKPDPMKGSRLGAFMTEAPRQSQPTPSANPPHDSPNCHYSEPVTQACHE